MTYHFRYCWGGTHPPLDPYYIQLCLTSRQLWDNNEQPGTSGDQADLLDLMTGPWDADDEFLTAEGSDPSLTSIRDHFGRL